MTYSSYPLIEDICHIAENAAARIMEIYSTDFSVWQKTDSSPLTTADMVAHETICDGLTKITPNIPILSEESVNIPYSQRRQWTKYWLVDPLDGTREFIKRNGEFTVNIALIENNLPTIGILWVPASNTCYFSRRGNGAFKITPDKQKMPLQVKKTEEKKLCIAGSRSHGNTQQTSLLEKLPNAKLTSMGSALKFCLIAEGKVDLYPRFGPTSEWDTAAAQCIVEEAGGSVTDMAFNPLRYNQKESLINPSFLVIADQTFNWQQYFKSF